MTVVQMFPEAMDLAQALEVRRRQRAGEPVSAGDLQLALFVIELQRPRPKGGRHYKPRLPKLSDSERHRINGVLLWRLGLALGRIEERKAA